MMKTLVALVLIAGGILLVTRLVDTKPYELIQRTTGGPMRIKPYIAYLRAKYGELYQFPSVEMSGRAAEGHI